MKLLKKSKNDSDNKDKTRVIIVEDRIELAQALKEALLEGGISALIAETAEEGIEMINKELPELLVIDILLPGKSGLELLEEIGPTRLKHPMRILLLSNVDAPEEIKKAREYDIDEYLVKSDWHINEIIKKIKKLL